MSDRWYWDEEEEERLEEPLEEKEPAWRYRRNQRSGPDERHSNWYLLTGLLLGLGLGLLFAWVISPVKYTDIQPSLLDDTYKDEYRRVIALAYQANGSLNRASQRLALLDSQGTVQILAAQAQRMLADNRSPEDARALAILAADLGRLQEGILSSPSPQPLTGSTQAARMESTAILPTSILETVSAVQSPTLPPPTRTATVTRTPLPTFTPRPTATPQPVLDAPFILKEKKVICDGSVPEGLVQIYVNGSDGAPLPGARVTVLWQDQQDVFYTGLVPEMGPGYADFLMENGVSYAMRVGEVSDTLEELSVPSCGGGWEITFEEGKQ